MQQQMTYFSLSAFRNIYAISAISIWSIYLIYTVNRCSKCRIWLQPGFPQKHLRILCCPYANRSTTLFTLLFNVKFYFQREIRLGIYAILKTVLLTVLRHLNIKLPISYHNAILLITFGLEMSSLIATSKTFKIITKTSTRQKPRKNTSAHTSSRFQVEIRAFNVTLTCVNHIINVMTDRQKLV